jgi:hypothetical protein
MVADTLDELHAMADKIGIQRKWFQNKSIPHYDICKTKRALAIENGVKEVSSRELVKVSRRKKCLTEIEFVCKHFDRQNAMEVYYEASKRKSHNCS